MKNESINWDEIPDVITKEQLRVLCHISKSTALYLLQSGKIPCMYTGKKTRCYKILKKDVMAYMADREEFPEYYKAAEGWYANRAWNIKLTSSLPEIREDLHEYYAHLLRSYPDVLDNKTISELTGYGKNAINNWCLKEHLQSFTVKARHMIPKVYLIDFFCSQYFRTIVRKSEWHVNTLKAYPNWKYRSKMQSSRKR